MKMKHLATAAAISMMASTAIAAPSVAKVGLCTVFDNGNIASRATCSINLDYTATTKKITLKTATDRYVIDAIHNGKDYAQAEFSLNGAPAVHYLREASTNKRTNMSEIQSSGKDVVACFESATQNICHS